MQKIPIGVPLGELAFPAGTFNRVVDHVTRHERDRSAFGGNPLRDLLPDSFRWKNTSGETAPLGAIIRLTGAAEIDNAVVLTGGKPNATPQAFYGVSLEIVANGTIGNGIVWNACRCHYDDGDTPAFGEIWGPKPDEWHLSKGYPGFLILGDPRGDEDSARVLAVQSPDATELFELTATLSPGGNAAAKILHFSGGDWTDSGLTTTVYDSLGDKNGVSGDRGWCVRSYHSKRREVVQLQC